MVDKITLTPVTGANNIVNINDNFTKIARVVNDEMLSRKVAAGQANQLLSPIDANGQRIYNLPDPTSAGEPVTFKFVQDIASQLAQIDEQVAEVAADRLLAEIAAQTATSRASEALTSATNAASYAGNAATSASQAAIQAGLSGGSASSAATSAGLAQIAATASEASRQVSQSSASAASTSAGNAATSATTASNAAASATVSKTDAQNAANQANSIAQSLAGGTIGFNASSYDFGQVTDATTYFNRDFGSLV